MGAGWCLCYSHVKCVCLFPGCIYARSVWGLVWGVCASLVKWAPECGAQCLCPLAAPPHGLSLAARAGSSPSPAARSWIVPVHCLGSDWSYIFPEFVGGWSCFGSAVWSLCLFFPFAIFFSFLCPPWHCVRFRSQVASQPVSPDSSAHRPQDKPQASSPLD